VRTAALQRERHEADFEALALLSAVEAGLFAGRRAPAPVLEAACARLWYGLAALAPSWPDLESAIDLQSGEWPATVECVARALETRGTVDRGRVSEAVRWAMARLPSAPSARTCEAALRATLRIDSLLAWLAVEVDARADGADASRDGEMPADASVLVTAFDDALGDTLGVLATRGEVRGTARLVLSPEGLVGTYDRGRRGLGLALAGLRLADTSSAAAGAGPAPTAPMGGRVQFARLDPQVRRSLIGMGAAGLPLRCVAVTDGALERASERGTALAALRSLKALVDAHPLATAARRYGGPLTWMPGSPPPTDPRVALVASAAIVARTLGDALAADIKEGSGAVGSARRDRSAVHAPPRFWEAARALSGCGVPEPPPARLTLERLAGVAAATAAALVDRPGAPS
jgi:hypothetical protein